MISPFRNFDITYATVNVEKVTYTKNVNILVETYVIAMVELWFWCLVPSLLWSDSNSV